MQKGGLKKKKNTAETVKKWKWGEGLFLRVVGGPPILEPSAEYRIEAHFRCLEWNGKYFGGDFSKSLNVLGTKNAHSFVLLNGTSISVQNLRKIPSNNRKHAGSAGLLPADLLHGPGDLKGGPQHQYLKKGRLSPSSIASLGHYRSYLML